MSQVLIVTGMHRSGTSLVASLFERAGVNLGAQLLASRHDNPFGYFEDVDFIDFHDNALHARGQNTLVTRDFVFTPTAAEEARARELIAARAARELWGWKDPRTSLFLGFWQSLLPDAKFLLVYRHPFDVIVSLARRGQLVGFDFYNALDSWWAYNACILEFARQHPNTSLVCSSYGVIEQIEQFNAVLEQKFSVSLDLNAQTRDEIFRAEHLRRTPRTSDSDALLNQIHPEALSLYNELQACAALKESEASVAPTSEISALSTFAGQLPQPFSEANRRALLTTLVALTHPQLYEEFAQGRVKQTTELEAQRRAWEQTAQARADLIREQTAWAEPRMKDLETLETNALVRALKRFGLVRPTVQEL